MPLAISMSPESSLKSGLENDPPLLPSCQTEMVKGRLSTVQLLILSIDVDVENDLSTQCLESTSSRRTVSRAAATVSGISGEECC
jgi:hypothetical protein